MSHFTRAQHIVLDVWLNHRFQDRELGHIADCIRRNFQVVHETEHFFDPQGLTQVFILSESHFSMHTYPEHNYLSLDIYICNTEINLEPVVAEILSKLDVREVQIQRLRRGIPGRKERGVGIERPRPLEAL